MCKKISVLAVAVALLLIQCSCRINPDAPEDQIINYRTSYEPFTLDPQIASDAAARLVIMNIFEGLVRLGMGESIIPGAAESWDISDDRLEYTFHIRKDAKWSDGTFLTADDFLYGLRRTFIPETGSDTAKSLYCIKNAESIQKGIADITTLGVIADGRDTLIIQLEYPEPDFLQLLTTPPAMPCQEDFFERAGGQYGRAWEKLLTNGAFCIKKNGWEHGEYIYLRRNENYNGIIRPVPAGIDIEIAADTVDMCRDIREGSTDCGEIYASEIKTAEETGLSIMATGEIVWGILFNTESKALRNTKLRQGLAAVLDREKLKESIPYGYTMTGNIIPDSAMIGDTAYRQIVGNNEIWKRKEAKELISRGLREEKAERVPEFVILCPDDEQIQRIASDLIEIWNGLTNRYINKKTVTISELSERISEGDYTIAITPLAVTGTAPLNTLQLFETGSRNIRALKSAEYDSIIEGIRRNQTIGSLDKIKKAERYLTEEVIFYPLFKGCRYYCCSEEVKRVIFHSYGGEADFIKAVKRPGGRKNE